MAVSRILMTMWDKQIAQLGAFSGWIIHLLKRYVDVVETLKMGVGWTMPSASVANVSDGFVSDKYESPPKTGAADFMRKLQRSGYLEEFRKNCLVAALKGYSRMVKNEEEGLGPVNRQRGTRPNRQKKCMAIQYAGVEVFSNCNNKEVNLACSDHPFTFKALGKEEEETSEELLKKLSNQMTKMDRLSVFMLRMLGDLDHLGNLKTNFWDHFTQVCRAHYCSI